jgi:hypothetical protein
MGGHGVKGEAMYKQRVARALGRTSVRVCVAPWSRGRQLKARWTPYFFSADRVNQKPSCRGPRSAYLCSQYAMRSASGLA